MSETMDVIRTPTSPQASLFDFPCRGHLLRGYVNPCPHPPTALKLEPKKQNSNVLETLGL